MGNCFTDLRRFAFEYNSDRSFYDEGRRRDFSDLCDRICALRIRLRQTPREWILDTYLSVLIIGFISWKFGMLVFDPIRTIQHPASLIYMTGGTKGIWLGAVLALVYAPALEQKGRIQVCAEVRTVVGICRRMGRVCIPVVVGGRGRCKLFIILYAIIRHIAHDELASIPFSAVPLSYSGIRKKWSGALIMGLFVWVIYDFALTAARARSERISECGKQFGYHC